MRTCQLCAGDGAYLPGCLYCWALSLVGARFQPWPEGGIATAKRKLVAGRTNAEMHRLNTLDARRFE